MVKDYSFQHHYHILLSFQSYSMKCLTHKAIINTFQHPKVLAYAMQLFIVFPKLQHEMFDTQSYNKYILAPKSVSLCNSLTHNTVNPCIAWKRTRHQSCTSCELDPCVIVGQLSIDQAFFEKIPCSLQCSRVLRLFRGVLRVDHNI